jgi:hypothetical protein
MFGFCVLNERKETCTVLRLISSIRTYTLTDSRPPSANPIPSPATSHTELREHRKRYGTAMRQNAGFTRVERNDARAQQIIASTNGRSATNRAEPRRHTATAAHDGSAF